MPTGMPVTRPPPQAMCPGDGATCFSDDWTRLISDHIMPAAFRSSWEEGKMQRNRRLISQRTRLSPRTSHYGWDASEYCRKGTTVKDFGIFSSPCSSVCKCNCIFRWIDINVNLIRQHSLCQPWRYSKEMNIFLLGMAATYLFTYFFFIFWMIFEGVFKYKWLLQNSINHGSEKDHCSR